MFPHRHYLALGVEVVDVGHLDAAHGAAFYVPVFVAEGWGPYLGTHGPTDCLVRGENSFLFPSHM